MKIEHIETARKLSKTRDDLLYKIECVRDYPNHPNYLGITFRGEYQIDNFVHKIRGAILNELTFQLHALESELQAMGIDL